MHTESDTATRTATLAVWVDPTMTRRATLAQRAMRMRAALAPVGMGLVLGMGLVMGRLIGPVI